MAEINSAEIGFEKEIWKAADKMRGNIDASEYKSVVLGLIFLKYISDKFEAKYDELVAEGIGMEEDKDEYLAENIFYVGRLLPSEHTLLKSEQQLTMLCEPSSVRISG